MKALYALGARARTFTHCAAMALALAGVTGAVRGESPNIIAVEEDWELVVGDPSQENSAPQVTCVISPVGSVDSLYAAFEINHQTQPTFDAGGLQLQVWNGEQHLSTCQFHEHGAMNTSGETVTWTQQLVLQGGTLTFVIAAGDSTTWHNFGGALRATVGSTLANLNAYSPEVSASKSGVGYASNRVSSLVLKRVRWYSQQGLVAEDDTPRVVYSHE